MQVCVSSITVWTEKRKSLERASINRVWKYGKQLVCCGCPVEGISAVFNAAAKLACHFIGMGSHVIEEAVLKQLFKLDTKKPSFCQHGALLFDEETEILL